MQLNIYACFSNYSGCRETLLYKLDMTGNFLYKKKKKKCKVCECMYWQCTMEA